MATQSSILAWEIPWTEEPGGLQTMRSQRVRHNLATKQQQLGGDQGEDISYYLSLVLWLQLPSSPDYSSS